MPLNTNAKRQPRGIGSHEVTHKVFLNARHNMHLVRSSEGRAEHLVEECVKARNTANTAFNTLSQAAKEGELSSSFFKDLSNAETSLQEKDTLLKEAEAKLEAAKQKSTTKLASFKKAKSYCEQASCPEFHGARDVIPDISKEELMAQKAEKEEQERRWYQQSQASAAKKRRMEDAEKEEKEWEEEKAREAKRQQTKEKYRESQGAKRRRSDEHTKKNPPNHAGSKPWNENEDERPFSRSYQDGPPNKPRSGNPRPGAQQRSSAQEPVAKPAKYQEWISTVKEALKDYASLSSFPSPPASACSQPTCMSEAQTRGLPACACDVRRCLSHLTVSQLKDCRALFHPDKFSRCRKDLVEGFKKQATEMFVVVEAMYGERKRKQSANQQGK